MLFGTDHEDDDEFSASKSSKLASLFGSDQNDVQEGNQSLQYKPPKQVHPKRPTSSTVPQQPDNKGDSSVQQGMALIYAAVVHTYKFEDGKQYVDTGKLGVAVVGNHESHVYRLLLYRGKQQAVASASISQAFTYTIQRNNYASFYDDQRQSYSIHFDNELSAIECAKQIGLARANSCITTQDSVIIQDLSVGEGCTAQEGTTITLKYTGYMIVNHSFGHVADETGSFIKVKLGSGELSKGFEAGVTGAAVGSSRLLLLSPKDQQTPRGTPRGPNDAVAYVVEFSSTFTDAKEDKPNLPSKPGTISSEEDTSVQARKASISKQLHTSPKVDKAKIISRMAKMGQPMLPFQAGVPAHVQSSESDTEDDRHASSVSPELPPKPHPRVPPHSKPTGTRVPDYNQPTLPLLQQHVQPQPSNLPLTYVPSQQLMPLPISGSNPYMVVSNQPYLGSPSGMDTHILLSEVRTQTTELRLQMGQMTDKVDRVLGKLEQSTQPTSYAQMEAGMLAHNIQRIIQENELLKNEIKEKNKKIEGQTERIADLLQQSQKFLEQSSSMLEQRSTYLESASLTSRITSLEHDKSLLEQELATTTTKLSNFESQLALARNNERRLSEQLAKQENLGNTQEEIKRLEEFLLDAQNKLETTESQLTEERKCKIELRAEMENLKAEQLNISATIGEISNLKAQHETLKTKLANAEKLLADQGTNSTESKAALSSEIKKIMNAVYRNLQKQFDDSQSYKGDEIKDILTSTIRTITLMVTERYNNSSSNNTTETEEAAVEKESQVAEIEPKSEPSVPSAQAEQQREDEDSWKPEPPPFTDDKEENADDWFL